MNNKHQFPNSQWSNRCLIPGPEPLRAVNDGVSLQHFLLKFGLFYISPPVVQLPLFLLSPCLAVVAPFELYLPSIDYIQAIIYISPLCKLDIRFIRIEGVEMEDKECGTNHPQKSRYATLSHKKTGHGKAQRMNAGVSLWAFYSNHFFFIGNINTGTGPIGSLWVTSLIVNLGYQGRTYRTGAPFPLLILYRLIYTAETVTEAEFFNLSFLRTSPHGLRFFLFTGIIGNIESHVIHSIRRNQCN